MEVEEELIEEAMKDYEIPEDKKEEFKLYLADDMWDWINENARSFSDNMLD